MWSLKPYKSPPSKCPKCSHENAGFTKHIFTGVHILGEGTCDICGTNYFHNWPIGHGLEFPISFTNNGLARYPPKAYHWMARPLIRAVKKGLKVTVTVRRDVRKRIKQALLLNCLDPCYGHVIWKLFNTYHHQRVSSPQGVVVLIPESCAWMVPDHVAEIWAVDVPLRDINFQIDSLDLFVQEVSDNYDTLQMLPVFTHIDHQEIEFYQYFRTEPFQISEFSIKRLCVTFIWREDRFWLRTRLEEWLSFAATKFSIDWLGRWFLYRQLRAMVRVANQVKLELPAAIFKITGLGTWGTFPEYFEDLRQLNMTEDSEKKWCQAFAQSHLVVGVHGSNMMIPTALSAGFIELLPTHKIPFISEDILMKHPGRYQTFLGRHLNMFTSTRFITRHIISIYKDFSYLYKNTSVWS